MPDAFNLKRFIDAQAPVYGDALRELAAGKKRGHWMWFIFPQLRGLGRSSTASFFGIASKAEALAYWRHPVLGARLSGCCSAILGVEGKSAHEVFGTPDDVKLRSSMTLFERAAPDAPVFARVLDRYFDGQRDVRTLELLGD